MIIYIKTASGWNNASGQEATQIPYPYIANAQNPFIRDAQQPYPYIANAQNPVIRDAQQPYIIANAQSYYIAQGNDNLLLINMVIHISESSKCTRTKH